MMTRFLLFHQAQDTTVIHTVVSYSKLQLLHSDAHLERKVENDLPYLPGIDEQLLGLGLRR